LCHPGRLSRGRSHLSSSTSTKGAGLDWGTCLARLYPSCRLRRVSWTTRSILIPPIGSALCGSPLSQQDTPVLPSGSLSILLPHLESWSFPPSKALSFRFWPEASGEARRHSWFPGPTLNHGNSKSKLPQDFARYLGRPPFDKDVLNSLRPMKQYILQTDMLITIVALC
jgi:hypothetical protein